MAKLKPLGFFYPISCPIIADNLQAGYRRRQAEGGYKYDLFLCVPLPNHESSFNPLF